MKAEKKWFTNLLWSFSPERRKSYLESSKRRSNGIPLSPHPPCWLIFQQNRVHHVNLPCVHAERNGLKALRNRWQNSWTTCVNSGCAAMGPWENGVPGTVETSSWSYMISSILDFVVCWWWWWKCRCMIFWPCFWDLSYQWPYTPNIPESQLRLYGISRGLWVRWWGGGVASWFLMWQNGIKCIQRQIHLRFLIDWNQLLGKLNKLTQPHYK